MKNHGLLSLSIAVLCSIATAGFSNSDVFAQNGSTDLFTESLIDGTLEQSQEPTIIRPRFVNINFGLLAGANDPPGIRTKKAKALTLNLFEDVIFTVIFDRIEQKRSGSISWIGRLKGVAYSQVILVVEGNMMAGNITMPGAIYQVRYAGNGVHAIYEIDQSAFPPEAEPTPIENSKERMALDATMNDDGSIIDILVVYTAAARSTAGSLTAMNTLIDLAVTETNTSYSNSGITQRLNLVHKAEVTYAESGNIQTDRNRLKATSDSFMDNVHTLRNTYAADVVTLIVENGGGYCGIAYIMTSVSTSFKTSAFNVTARSCATGYYSFGHELGHIMSARHDWYFDPINNSP